jgi:PAS domain S-box-containing protein
VADIPSIPEPDPVNELERLQREYLPLQEPLAWRTVLNTLPYWVFWKGEDLHYLGANRAFLKGSNLTLEEIEGKTDFEMPWKERAAFYRQIDQRVLALDRPETMTERALPHLGLRKDGRDLWIRVSKVPLRDAAGNPRGVLGVIQDITEEHRLEEAIRALVALPTGGTSARVFEDLTRHLARILETRFAVVGELVQGGGGKLRTLALWDGQTCTTGLEYPLEGYPCGEVVGRQFREFRENLLELFPRADLLRPLEVESYLGAPLFDAAGMPLGQVAVLDTRPWSSSPAIKQILEMFAIRASAEIERQRIDQRLRRAHAHLERRVEERTADLAAAHESLRSLLHIVSHDLRAPLVNLKGFAGELQAAGEKVRQVVTPHLKDFQEAEQRHLQEALEEDIPEALDFIDTSINRIDSFMNTLLRLSAEGRRDLHMELLNVNQLVDEILRILAYQIEQRRTVVTVGRLPEVVADQISMEQILSNLLSNAVLYLDPDRPGKIEVSGERTEEHVIFRIRDNGRGIPKDDQGKLFLPFRRGRYTDVEGEGMGLAYVEALVRRHGGRIRCESEVGVGSTFTFSVSAELMENDPRTGVHLLAPIQELLGT